MMFKIIKPILGLTLSLYLIPVFAFEIPGNLIGTWTETSNTYDPDIVVINPNKIITHTMARQVGREGSKIPYPTVCYYKERGRIGSIKYKDNSMFIEYKLNHVELIKSESTLENCMKFINSIPLGVFSHSWDVTMVNTNTLQQGKTIFQKS